MVDRLSVDTTFLIDIQRERAHGDTDGAAHHFLRGNADAELYLSDIALGEFAEGFPTVEHPLVIAVRQRHILMPVDDHIALVYAAITRDLRGRGELIGGNDLWIAATTLRHDLPLVTADVDHFGRIDDLDMIGYR